tara:strand:- start:5801 stop:6379 length:579 start_codon:yes stop_codon:yes gene_type:complete
LNVLIAGDSFAAEWPGHNSWVKLLARDYDVTNVAQAGVSEYKILQQIQTANLDEYDLIIVSHTSLSRVHTPKHPLHKEGLHKDCDLIFNDINRISFFNASLKAAKDYFKYHYDDKYYQTVYSLLRKEINTILAEKKYLSMSHVEVAKLFIHEDNHLDFSEFWQSHKGTENHYNITGNQKIYDIVVDKINKLC